jgi:VWFA-related protein
MKRVVCLLAFGAVSATVIAQAPQQAPVFRTGVDIIAVEVQVVGKDTLPIRDLNPLQFDVRIDGKPRRVRSLDLVDFSKSDPPPLDRRLPTVATPLGLLPVASPFERTFVIAVDELSFRTVGGRSAIEAAQHFVDKLRPEDLVGVFPFPTMPKTLDLTHRHIAVKTALGGLTARAEHPISEFNLTASEIVDITASDRDTFEEVVTRECSPTDLNCRDRVFGEASQLAGYHEADTGRRVMSLRLLLDALSRLPSRKTLLIVSGGLISTDRTAGRPDITTMTHTIGKEAAIANTNLYVMHLDYSLFEAFSANRPRGNIEDSFRDSTLFSLGLENVAGAAGGQYLRTENATANHLFDRVLRESSAHYLLGVEPSPQDQDGKLHAIRVKVNAKGTTVRNRTYVVIPKPRR